METGFPQSQSLFDVARDFAFCAAPKDRCTPALTKLKACMFNLDASMVSKSTSTGMVEFALLFGAGLIVLTVLVVPLVAADAKVIQFWCIIVVEEAVAGSVAVA
jgi:hypothetical protein